MSQRSPVSVWFELVKPELERIVRLDKDIHNIILSGPDITRLLHLKEKRRTETKAAEKYSVNSFRRLRSANSEVIESMERSERTRAARDVQWLMTQFAKHLVDNGYAPPPWDADLKPPSFKYIDVFLRSRHRDALGKWRQYAAALGKGFTSMDKIDSTSYLAAKACNLREREDGTHEIMCLEGFCDVAVLIKAAELIKGKFTFVPYVPPETAPTTDPPFRPVAPPASLDSIVVAACSAGNEADRLEGELVTLFLEDPSNEKLIEEKNQQITDVIAAQKDLHNKAFELCQEWTAARLAAIPTAPGDNHLRSFKETYYLLTQLGIHFYSKGVLATKMNWCEVCDDFRFDTVLEFLHSTDLKPKLARRREKLHATFTDSEWQVLADVNARCFHALFNRAPLVVDGIPEVMAMALPREVSFSYGHDPLFVDKIPEDTQVLTSVAELLRRDLRLIIPPSKGGGNHYFYQFDAESNKSSLPVAATRATKDSSDDDSSDEDSSDEDSSDENFSDEDSDSAHEESAHEGSAHEEFAHEDSAHKVYLNDIPADEASANEDYWDEGLSADEACTNVDSAYETSVFEPSSDKDFFDSDEASTDEVSADEASINEASTHEDYSAEASAPASASPAASSSANSRLSSLFHSLFAWYCPSKRKSRAVL